MVQKSEASHRELDIDPGTDLLKVKESYRQLVKVWHPDRFNNDQKLQLIANNKLKKINSAYELLVAHLEKGRKIEAASPSKTEACQRESQVSSAQEIYYSGLGRYNMRDYDGAEKLFRQAAEMGNAKGQYAVGYMLYEHMTRNIFTLRQQSKNEAEAFGWWRKAANQENPNAQYMMGIFYQYAVCTPYNGTEARKWFERAASNGHSLAKARLGKLAVLHSIRAVPLVSWYLDAPPSPPRPS